VIVNTNKKAKREYGDFQTPLELAQQVCQQLCQLNIHPNIIIEPTCGIGNFIYAATSFFPQAHKIIGMDINEQYLQKIQDDKYFVKDHRIELLHKNFFEVDWQTYINQLDGEILVLGNLPWVTNSQQGDIGSDNLPKKQNFQKLHGLDAITGKSNFDISEWMLIQLVRYLHHRNSNLAMLCKTSVSRKILNYLYSHHLHLEYCATYAIDAQKLFGAAVDACLLLCKFNPDSKNYYCDVFDGFGQQKIKSIGYKNNILVRDINSFEKLSGLYNVNNVNTKINTKPKWRSGIKHDCSNIMELHRVGDLWMNGLGESVDIEETYLFPLMKGSDIAQNRIQSTNRYVIVPQKFVGESTALIKDLAPKTWAYLEAHASYFNNRKSKIYKKHPSFSIFGVGDYTFTNWKIAICGLYKKLEFRLVSSFANKPIVFDDTVYFLGFNNAELAHKYFELLTSEQVTSFYSSQIFWDEKRPIKASILNSLNLAALEVEL